MGGFVSWLSDHSRKLPNQFWHVEMTSTVQKLHWYHLCPLKRVGIFLRVWPGSFETRISDPGSRTKRASYLLHLRMSTLLYRRSFISAIFTTTHIDTRGTLLHLPTPHLCTPVLPTRLSCGLRLPLSWCTKCVSKTENCMQAAASTASANHSNTAPSSAGAEFWQQDSLGGPYSPVKIQVALICPPRWHERPGAWMGSGLVGWAPPSWPGQRCAGARPTHSSQSSAYR